MFTQTNALLLAYATYLFLLDINDLLKTKLIASQRDKNNIT